MILNRSIEGWGRFWKRIGSKPNFKDKTVVGYGCGHGCDTLEILRAGAKKVIALDIVPEYLKTVMIFAYYMAILTWNSLKTNIPANLQLKSVKKSQI